VSGGLAVTVAPSGADVRPVTDIEGVEDVNDAERRGVEDVDGAAGVDDFDGTAGVRNAGKGAGRDGRLGSLAQGVAGRVSESSLCTRMSFGMSAEERDHIPFARSPLCEQTHSPSVWARCHLLGRTAQG